MSDERILEIFNDFTQLLYNRFSKKIYTTEDSIRYTLFYSITKLEGFLPSDFIMEYPHPKIPKAKIDTFITAKDKMASFAFELKFDRKIPSGRNSPKPQKAGKIFSDIFRLVSFKTVYRDTKCFLVYVTDMEMAIYFNNNKNGLNDFFNLKPGRELEIDTKYVTKNSDTFVVYAGNVVDCKIVNIINTDLSQKFFIRIYEIQIH